jgi:hypothetical protein
LKSTAEVYPQEGQYHAPICDYAAFCTLRPYFATNLGGHGTHLVDNQMGLTSMRSVRSFSGCPLQLFAGGSHCRINFVHQARIRLDRRYFRFKAAAARAAETEMAFRSSKRLSEIPRHLLRVSCRRCDRIVEIRTADAMRIYRQHAIWKDVGCKLLGVDCQVRTGRHEEDGCWPAFE